MKPTKTNKYLWSKENNCEKTNVISCDCPICSSNLKKYHVNMISSTNVECNFNSLCKQNFFNVEPMNITWKTRRYDVTTTKHVIWIEHLQEACHNNKEINSTQVIWTSTWQLSKLQNAKMEHNSNYIPKSWSMWNNNKAQ